LLVEEGRLGRHATLTRGGPDVDRGFDAQARYAGSDRVLEQVTVIAGDFHHERLGTESKAVRGLLDEPLGVLHPAVGVGGKIRVLGECYLRGD
jgi:hypothetical protein